MGNSRAFRRRVQAAQPSETDKPKRQPWNKGKALTTNPSLGTTRRWLNGLVDIGHAERRVREPDGKPGRPPFEYHITEAGKQYHASRPHLPLDVEIEQARRQENARKRRGMQRRARKMKALDAKAVKLRQKVSAAEKAAEEAARAVEQAKAERLMLDIAIRATKALIDGGGDSWDASVLLPEELDVLLETGCAVLEDGKLAIREDWLTAYREAVKR